MVVKVVLDEELDQSWKSHPALDQITHIPVAVGTNNIGDDIQSLAMRRLLRQEVGYVNRDRPQEWKTDEIVPLCGWFGYGEFPTKASVLVVGFHCRGKSMPNLYENKEWLKSQVKEQGFPAMCRDLSTRNYLRTLGIDAEFGGCVTLLLEKRDAPRLGERLSIDDLSIPRQFRDKRVTQMDQSLAGKSPEERLALAAARVELLANARFVESSRLHVILPCHALGTPYKFVFTDAITERERLTGYGLLPGYGSRRLEIEYVPGYSSSRSDIRRRQVF